MLAHTKKHLIKQGGVVIIVHHAGSTYSIPKKIAEKYRVENEESVSAESIFSHLNKKYTKAGALLRGLRIRDGLTQTQMAKKIRITQSDISQIENGVRNIGRIIAKRIEKHFGVDYRSFLE